VNEQEMEKGNKFETEKEFERERVRERENVCVNGVWVLERERGN